MNTLKIFLLSFCFLFAFGIVSAQETENSAEAVALDENVTAEDLGVAEPTVLPNSPFYFLKNLGRTIQSTVTLDPVKKAKLKERFANEKLIELKKLVEKTQNPEVIKKATENYQKEVENVKKAAERIKEKAGENQEVGKFLDKFTQQSVLHQAILQKLEDQVPEKALEKITEAREAHLEKFGEVMNRLENKERIQERLENNLQKVEGSEFKNFKNLEMLQALEEKAPEAMKKAVQQVRVNVMTQLKEDVKEMTAEKLERFQTYTENVSGVKERQMEILESLKTELQNSPQVIQKLIQTRNRIIEQVKENIENKNEGAACPEIAKPTSTFCQNGRMIIKKDDKGCIAAFNCVVPAETNVVPQTTTGTQACTTLWKPVCGKNGKTYSNSCFAKIAGIEIDYEGACKSLETGTSPQIREQIKSLIPKLTP